MNNVQVSGSETWAYDFKVYTVWAGSIIDPKPLKEKVYINGKEIGK